MKKLFGLFSQYKGLRREIYVLFFGRIVTNLGSMVYPMLTMILSQKLGFDAASISILMVVAMALMMPANLLGGALADRFGRKKVLYAITGLFWASLLLLILAPSPGS